MVHFEGTNGPDIERFVEKALDLPFDELAAICHRLLEPGVYQHRVALRRLINGDERAEMELKLLREYIKVTATERWAKEPDWAMRSVKLHWAVQAIFSGAQGIMLRNSINADDKDSAEACRALTEPFQQLMS